MLVLLRVTSVAACRRSGSAALTIAVAGGDFARSISSWVVGRILPALQATGITASVPRTLFNNGHQLPVAGVVADWLWDIRGHKDYHKDLYSKRDRQKAKSPQQEGNRD